MIQPLKGRCRDFLTLDCGSCKVLLEVSMEDKAKCMHIPIHIHIYIYISIHARRQTHIYFYIFHILLYIISVLHNM